MNNVQKKLAKKYLQQVKAKIPYHTKCSKHMLQNLALGIDEYTLENPDFTFEQLIENFGSPEDIASTLLENVASKDIIHSIKQTRTLICTIVLLIIVFAFCIRCIAKTEAVGIEEVIYMSKPATTETTSGN